MVSVLHKSIEQQYQECTGRTGFSGLHDDTENQEMLFKE